MSLVDCHEMGTLSSVMRALKHTKAAHALGGQRPSWRSSAAHLGSAMGAAADRWAAIVGYSRQSRSRSIRATWRLGTVEAWDCAPPRVDRTSFQSRTGASEGVSTHCAGWLLLRPSVSRMELIWIGTPEDAFWISWRRSSGIGCASPMSEALVSRFAKPTPCWFSTRLC